MYPQPLCQFKAIAALEFPWRAIPSEFGVNGFVCRRERQVIHWKLLAEGSVGIVTILHERMHEIEQFQDDWQAG